MLVYLSERKKDIKIGKTHNGPCTSRKWCKGVKQHEKKNLKRSTCQSYGSMVYVRALFHSLVAVKQAFYSNINTLLKITISAGGV
jgi:hypothetical protein